jgi:DNA-binding NarL/FixJ family response regulator
MTIMIVDDNDRMREMIRTILSKSVDQFIECRSGEEALKAYSEQEPDYVLMDIVMGGIDGITATKQLTKAHPKANVIIVSQFSDTDLRERAKRAGAIGYVLKENLSEIKTITGSR